MAFRIAIKTLVLLVASAATLDAAPIGRVSTSRDFFNPGLSESVTVSSEVDRPGVLTFRIIDRDGFVVRRLPNVTAKVPGRYSFIWNGRSDNGETVPDEAYSFKIDFEHDGGAESYFPAAAAAHTHTTIRVDTYDRRTGALRYSLPKPSRVHVQAGSAKVNRATGATSGPVLKTIVNRAPRIAGSIVETWQGFDESGTIDVTALPDFVVSIAATPLPQNSVITVGNRRETFAESVARRDGLSLLPTHPPSHHHGGLSTLDDISPSASLKPENAKWNDAEKTWTTSDASLRIALDLSGPGARRFASQPGRVMVFVDQEKVLEVKASVDLRHLAVPLSRSHRGAHVIAINWVSDYGPVAASSVRVRKSSKS